jgi:hypothetical protein
MTATYRHQKNIIKKSTERVSADFLYSELLYDLAVDPHRFLKSVGYRFT